MIKLTKEQARHFLLLYHGLTNPPLFKGKKGILDYIRRVGCIQFDPLNKVGHNQELVLQSRVKDFKPALLEELLYKDRLLLDGWDKCMSIYPVEDWPFFEPLRQSDLERMKQNSEVMAVASEVIDQIDKRGPLSSSDLIFNRTVNWSWAPTTLSRATMESLYFAGKLVVHHKKGTRKFYDLTEKNLPSALLAEHNPYSSKESYLEAYVLRRIRGIGLLWNKAGDGWLGISNLKSAERTTFIQHLLEVGKLLEIQIEGIKEPLYMAKAYEALLIESLPQRCGPQESTHKPQPAKLCKTAESAFFLAPLDNLLWERRLVKELFDFDYRWEVYKPESQREFGYYVLPVLYGDKFVARFEPLRDKTQNALVIKNWWWEPGVRKNKALKKALQQCFERFKNYLSVETVIFPDDPFFSA